MIRLEPVLRHADQRGALIKAWPGAVAGEVYAVELRPHHPRGHHWHTHGGEWFIPLAGSAWLVTEDPDTGERCVAKLEHQRAYVPAGIAHALFCDHPALVLAVAEVVHEQECTTPHLLAPPTASERFAAC